MNEKLGLQDLAALLSEKAAIAKKDAETFLREYFEVMNEELINSGLLKIKDLGFFKLSLMDDRESINVTTGERFLIPAHYKVTFTPDKKLADTVNEPFALFETTEIEDESGLDDLVTVPEKNALGDSANEEDDDNEELASDVDEGIVIETPAPAVKVEAPVVEEAPAANEDEKDIIYYEEAVPVPLIEEPVPVMEEPDSLVEEPVPVMEEQDSLVEDEIDIENPINDNKIIDNMKQHYPNGWTGTDPSDPSTSQPGFKDPDERYKDKYLASKKRLKRLQMAIYFLAIVLIGVVGYMLFNQSFDKSRKTTTVISPQEQTAQLRDSTPSGITEPKDSNAIEDSQEEVAAQAKADQDAKAAQVKADKDAKAAQVKADQDARAAQVKADQDARAAAKKAAAQAKADHVVKVAVQTNNKATKPVTKVDQGESPVNPNSNSSSITESELAKVAAMIKRNEQGGVSDEPVNRTEPVDRSTPVDRPAPVNRPSAPVVAATGGGKQITVSTGQRLTLISLKEYGDKAFWIYIYLENKDVIKNPDVLPAGLRISIPPASKYDIDSSNPESIQKAKDTLARYR